MDELLLDSVIEEFPQRIVIAFDVQQSARFVVQAELRPGPDFEDFFQGADAAGQGNESVGKLRHQHFSGVHGRRYVQFGQVMMRHFLEHQCFRNDADSAASQLQHMVGHDAHDADARSAVNQSDIPLDHRFG